VFNFSPRAQHVTVRGGPFAGNYRDFTTDETVRLEAGTVLDVPAWGYRVFTR
jgi:hypothetical protein